jgi:hypothetical protein
LPLPVLVFQAKGPDELARVLGRVAATEIRTTMERRSLLKLAGGIAGTTAIGYGLTGGVGAETTKINFNAVSPESREFDDGEVTAVSVLIEDGEIKWDGLEYDADTISLSLRVYDPESEDYVEVETKELDLPGDHAKQGAREFDMGPVDITNSDSPFTDEDFSKDEDGGVKNTQVSLRLVATVNTMGDGYSVTNQGNDTFTVGVENQPNSVTGGVESQSPVTFAGNIIDQEGNILPESVHHRVYYGADAIEFEMDLSNYEPLISDGAPLNGAIGIDWDNDSVAEVQFGWLPGTGGPELALKENTGGGWSNWRTVDDYRLVSAEESGGVVTFTVDRGFLGDGLAPDDYYRTGFAATAGGEEEKAVVSDDNQNFWSTANGYTSSEHFIVTQAE